MGRDDTPQRVLLDSGPEKAEVDKLSQLLSPEQEREGRDRSWIARLVLWLFAVSLAAAFVVFALDGLLTKNWEKPSSEAVDLVKSAVLPVVTLVLGYYFGRSGKS